MDNYGPEPDHETQKKWFLRQLDLAREIRKPVIIHSRDAAKDTVDLMTEARAEEIGGVIHVIPIRRRRRRFSWIWDSTSESAAC